MTVKAKMSPREKAVRAALKLAAKKGWDRVSLRAVAAETKIPLHDLHDIFEDRADILAAYGRMIDRQVMEQTGAPDPALSARDRLFDILMARFDVLNEDRKAVQSILRAVKCDPKQAIITLPHVARSMSWMLEAAGIETADWRGAAKVLGLAAVYLKTLWIWLDDNSEDMAKTMAALDKGLEQAERWGATFGMTDKGEKG